MKPIIAIIGQANVGKSTLFNQLTKSRHAIVANEPHLTRNRHEGIAHWNDHPVTIIDTGGITESREGLHPQVTEQAFQAVEEADIILFVVNARIGLTPADQHIADRLRRLKPPHLYIVANKTDGLDPDSACSDFYSLGLGDIYPIAASHGRGVTQLLETVLNELNFLSTSDTDTSDTEKSEETQDDSIHFAIIGRPNVGKSTLCNRMLGEARSIVCDSPGTTRDSLSLPLVHHDKRYTLVDTAGVRRRGRIFEKIEKFSVSKTLQAVKKSVVALVVFDASEGITDQDLHLVDFVIKSGRSLILVINKWDDLDTDKKNDVKKQIERRLEFANFAELHFISALHGSNVGHLFQAIDKAYQTAYCHLSTAQLTATLLKAVAKHPPPLSRRQPVKLRYAHLGGHNPPCIVIHGKRTFALPVHYQRYLINTFRKTFRLVGTPIKLEFR